MRKKLEFQSDRIDRVLSLHNISARVTGGTVTPRWIRFEILPSMDARISQIKALHEELARALNVEHCRLARRGVTVDLEIPRDDPQPVRLLPLWHQLTISDIPPATAILGLAENGAPLLIRLPSPDVAHILVSGTTGSGKTVLLQTLVLSLAMRHPDVGGEVGMVLIDPRRSDEFQRLSTLPHLMRPLIDSPEEAIEALRSAVHLMEVRDREDGPAIPVVIVIDELVDLLMTGGDAAQKALTRLLQRGRGAGIHVVAATQKPTSAVLGPLIKANFPVRLVGKVSSASDARVASGWSGTGAERLQGKGDFVAVAEGRVMRFQVAYITPREVRDVLAQHGWTSPPHGRHKGSATTIAEPSMTISLPPPPDPRPAPDPIDRIVEQLRAAGWHPSWSKREACRKLGRPEGGSSWWDDLSEAIERLERGATATATKNKNTDPPGVRPN